MANKSENNEKVRALKQVEWQLLFNLIPEIEATEQFAEIEEGKMLEDGTVSNIVGNVTGTALKNKL